MGTTRKGDAPESQTLIEETPKGPLIYGQMAKIMADIEPVTKSRTNTQGQGYKFRGIDDLYNALNKVLSKHGVFTTSTVLNERSEEKQTKSGGTLIYRIIHYRWTFWAVDGTFVQTETIGEAMDSGDKASNKSMSAAHKYALLQTFCVPTEEQKDTEYDSHEVTSKPVTVSRPTVADGFDPQNRNHQDYIMKIFQSRNVPEDYWDEIALKVKGAPGSQLVSMVDKCLTDLKTRSL